MHRWIPTLIVVAMLGCGPTTPTPLPTPTPIPSPSPTATPTPAPAACPSLNQWRGHLYQCTIHGILSKEPGENGKPIPVAGGNCTIDTTEFFNTVSGIAPCNDEHPNCGVDMGHQCEDPLGPSFIVLESHAGSEGREHNPNQFEFRNLGSGHYKVVVSPRFDLVDYFGRPVTIDGPGSKTIAFNVP